MNPYRTASKVEIFKRSWFDKKLRKFRINFLTFIHGNLKRRYCKYCKKQSSLRKLKSSADFVFYWDCIKCENTNWME
jgi:NAD-dependent SIR2 family protein deacetylase